MTVKKDKVSEGSGQGDHLSQGRFHRGASEKRRRQDNSTEWIKLLKKKKESKEKQRQGRNSRIGRVRVRTRKSKERIWQNTSMGK